MKTDRKISSLSRCMHYRLHGPKILWAIRNHRERPEWKVMKPAKYLKERSSGWYDCPFCSIGILTPQLESACGQCEAIVCEITKNYEYWGG
jgi:hypothetical protein